MLQRMELALEGSGIDNITAFESYIEFKIITALTISLVAVLGMKMPALRGFVICK